MSSDFNHFAFTRLRKSVVVDEVITIFYFEQPPKYRFDGESHNFWELMYIDRGELLIRLDGHEQSMKAGEAILYSPNFFHSHHATQTEPVNMIIVSFTCQAPELMQIADRILTLSKHQIRSVNSIIAEARHAFSGPLEFYTSCELIRRTEQLFGAEQLIAAHLESLMISLIRREEAAQPDIQTTIREMTDNERANKIINFLHDNLYRRISIEDVCRHTRLSPTCIKTLFRNVTGTTMIRYFTDMKIEEAKHLLRKGIYSVSEISDLLSYSSIQHFSKQFHSRTGYTPTQYAATIKAHNPFTTDDKPDGEAEGESGRPT